MNSTETRKSSKFRLWVEAHPIASTIIVTALFIIIVAGITILFTVFKWSWNIFAIIMGIIIGFLLGSLFIQKLSTRARVGAMGAITGMGIDFGATAAGDGKASTAIHSLSSVISSIVDSILKIPVEQKFNVEMPVTIGIWIMVAVVALTYLFSRIFIKGKMAGK